jgi:ribonuclease H / adenosylcobalamin/alpha-ribazole phosphatase
MLILHADGGCQPNPGDGTIGVVAFRSGECIHTHSEAIGHATNNIAEWSAALWALQYAIDSGDPEVELRMDSRMVVMQLNGKWKVKHPGLKPFAAKGAELVQRLRRDHIRLTINWIGRESNSEADAAAGAAQKHYVPMWAR